MTSLFRPCPIGHSSAAPLKTQRRTGLPSKNRDAKTAKEPPIQERCSPEKRLDLKLTLTFSMQEWDVANPNSEECHEWKERAVCRNSKEGYGGRRIGAVGGRKWGSGVASARRDAVSRKQGKADDHDAEQVLLQHQGADGGGADAPQATRRQADGGAERSRRHRQWVRIPV